MASLILFSRGPACAPESLMRRHGDLHQIRKPVVTPFVENRGVFGNSARPSVRVGEPVD